MDRNPQIAHDGKRHKIGWAYARNGSCPAKDFFNELSITDKAKILKLFALLGDDGKRTNPEKFGVLGEGIFEFKSFQTRMPFAYCRSNRGLVLVTHGFIKKSGKAPPSEIARALRILGEHYEYLAPSKIAVVGGNRTRGKS